MNKLLTTLVLIMNGISMMSACDVIYMTVGERSAIMTPAGTEAARSLLNVLGSGPMTVRLTDYGGFEKVGPLPAALPASDTRMTTEAGDVMLYQGRNIVVFYGSNTWSYTRLGKIEPLPETGLRDFFGQGETEITFSLSPKSGIGEISQGNRSGSEIIYDLQGNRLRQIPDTPGVYIINGVKTIIK